MAWLPLLSIDLAPGRLAQRALGDGKRQISERAMESYTAPIWHAVE